MALIDITGLSTVFGPRPAHALAQVRAGMDKATLLAQTGHSLALNDVNLQIEAGEVFVIMGLSGFGQVDPRAAHQPPDRPPRPGRCAWTGRT